MEGGKGSDTGEESDMPEEGDSSDMCGPEEGETVDPEVAWWT